MNINRISRVSNKAIRDGEIDGDHGYGEVVAILINYGLSKEEADAGAKNLGRFPSQKELARQHKPHDGMCNLNNPVCKAYVDSKIDRGEV